MSRAWVRAGLALALVACSGPKPQVATPAAPELPPEASGVPVGEPILRIEAGMHAAMINRVGVDALGRYVVTASDDKTARVWDARTGELLRVLRPPIATGNAGMLYAVAMSPDGALVVTGGWTEGDDLYVFDRETGRMRSRASGMGNVVKHIAFSVDGQRVAAMLGGRAGLRLFAVEGATLREIARDDAYGADSYGAAFAPDGRLATSAWDGLIRLYDAAGNLRWTKSAPGGPHPFGVAFSPDGERLAVGDQGSPRVDVLHGQTLEPLFTCDSAGLENGNVSSVAFSADGSVLYAGGTHSARRRAPLIAWAAGGRGGRRALAAARSTIMDVVTLADGRVVFGTADPAWGVLDREGASLAFRGPSLADFPPAPVGQFLVSDDARRVQFGFVRDGSEPAVFDLEQRTLTLGAGEDLHPPRTRDDALEVTDWTEGTAPKLNGDVLALNDNEDSRAAHVLTDTRRVLLGAIWSLRLFDGEGVQLWDADVPGVTWSVNASADERLAVAAHDDGTIRWYSTSDGSLLLSFFPHLDKERWVVWTPSGDYDASPGGEALIGWHVNYGPDRAAGFEPAATHRARHHRPEVIDQVLGPGGRTAALDR